MSGAPDTALSDKELLDWLEEQVVDVIHLDDGRVIDVAGDSVRAALAKAAIAWTVGEHSCLLGAVEFLYSGQRVDGERWTCPDCRKIWEHVCNEDAGCYWQEVNRG